MERWDIYDINRCKTGRTALRGCSAAEGGLQEGEYHLVVHICIFNTKGELLMQRRQKDKEGYPDLWDVSAAGSALAGETSAQAAARELFEELGIVHDFSSERPFLTSNFERGFDDWYFIQRDVDLCELHLQAQEVQDARWIDLAGVEQMMEQGKMIPYYPDFVRLWFAMRLHRGTTTHE